MKTFAQLLSYFINQIDSQGNRMKQPVDFA